MPVLDACATMHENGEVAVFAVNRSTVEAVTVRIGLADLRVTSVVVAEVMGGDDPKVDNTWEEPNRVGMRAGMAKVIDGQVEMTVPRTGFGVVRVRTEVR